MKKTWNKLIIVSFIVLAVVACAAIVFLYPYYNEYKVFDGIEAGQWNEVQKSYEALDSEKQKAVQEMLPDYAKHICLEYQTGEKDYIYTVAAYDAINSIDETKSICTKYNVLVNRTEYRDAIEQIYNSNQNYNGQGVVQANETINKSRSFTTQLESLPISASISRGIARSKNNCGFVSLRISATLSARNV